MSFSSGKMLWTSLSKRFEGTGDGSTRAVGQISHIAVPLTLLLCPLMWCAAIYRCRCRCRYREMNPGTNLLLLEQCNKCKEINGSTAYLLGIRKSIKHTEKKPEEKKKNREDSQRWQLHELAWAISMIEGELSPTRLFRVVFLNCLVYFFDLDLADSGTDGSSQSTVLRA